jgi:sulfur carrier protein
MKVIMNGEERTVPENINIEKLLEHFELAGRRVAIELNNNVVRRKDWPETTITEADKIEVVHFVGGG